MGCTGGLSVKAGIPEKGSKQVTKFDPVGRAKTKTKFPYKAIRGLKIRTLRRVQKALVFIHIICNQPHDAT